MQIFSQASNFEPGRYEAQRHPNLFLLYRDGAHERLGRSYCELFSAEMGWHDQFTLTEWKFEMLAAPGLSEFALADAKGAQVMAVATRAGEQMPDEVKSLIARIDAANRWPFLMVVLLSTDSKPEQSCPDYSFLLAEANRLGAGLLVYVNPDENRFDLNSAIQLTVEPPLEGLNRRDLARVKTAGARWFGKGVYESCNGNSTACRR